MVTSIVEWLKRIFFSSSPFTLEKEFAVQLGNGCRMNRTDTWFPRNPGADNHADSVGMMMMFKILVALKSVAENNNAISFLGTKMLPSPPPTHSWRVEGNDCYFLLLDWITEAQSQREPTGSVAVVQLKWQKSFRLSFDQGKGRVKAAPVLVSPSSLFGFGLFSDNFNRQRQMSITCKACWENYRGECDTGLSFRSSLSWCRQLTGAQCWLKSVVNRYILR